jgi:SAM-dependent methyltransferase
MKIVRPFAEIFFLKTIWSIKILFSPGRFARAQFLSRAMFSGALRYWRVWEFAYALDSLPKRRNLKILDISSPKILAFYAARKYGHEITGIDIWNEELVMWRDMLRRIGNLRNAAGRVQLAIEDATCLAHADESFDAVYSISAIEHIDGMGDAKAIKEVSRVLKKGGVAVLTVPYDEKGYDVFKNEDVYRKKFTAAPVFYERWYSRDMLQERLLKDSGLELVDLRLGFEKCLRLHHKVIAKAHRLPYPIRILWSTVDPVIGLLNLRVSADLRTRKEGVALLTLRKPMPA